MITLTRMNGRPLLVNALLIESIEETPDTMITLINGKKLIVLEKGSVVSGMVQQYMQSIGLIGTSNRKEETED